MGTLDNDEFCSSKNVTRVDSSFPQRSPSRVEIISASAFHKQHRFGFKYEITQVYCNLVQILRIQKFRRFFSDKDFHPP